LLQQNKIGQRSIFNNDQPGFWPKSEQQLFPECKNGRVREFPNLEKVD